MLSPCRTALRAIYVGLENGRYVSNIYVADNFQRLSYSFRWQVSTPAVNHAGLAVCAEMCERSLPGERQRRGSPSGYPPLPPPQNPRHLALPGPAPQPPRLRGHLGGALWGGDPN